MPQRKTSRCPKKTHPSKTTETVVRLLEKYHLTQNYDLRKIILIYFSKITNFTRNSAEKSFFPRDFEGANSWNYLFRNSFVSEGKRLCRVSWLKAPRMADKAQRANNRYSDLIAKDDCFRRVGSVVRPFPAVPLRVIYSSFSCFLCFQFGLLGS